MALQYLEHSRRVLSNRYSAYKPNRTGVDSISLFGHQSEYDLSEGFPLVTTKKVSLKPVIHELLWFLKGSGNIKYLVDNGVHIWDGNALQHHLKRTGLEGNFPMYSNAWQQELKIYIEKIKTDDEFAAKHGDLGPVYGRQWRHWKTSDGKELDQIADAIKLLRKSPQSRRILVTAWNPEEVPSMALPPCHTMFQLNVADGRLDCQLYQRSCDMFLGVPFNIASYAMLTQIFAQEADLEPGRFVHTFGDAHFYCGTHERGEFYRDNLGEIKERVRIAQGRDFLDIKNWIEKTAPAERAETLGQDHVTAILEQLSREPKPLPKMEISKKPFGQLTFEDFRLNRYDPHPPIKRAMAV
jgi:thymidylate synthase